MEPSRRIIIPPASAVSFEVTSGSVVRVTDIEGQQVADFIAFNGINLRERISTSRTRSENGTIHITKGHHLFSNQSNVMLTIITDTCGVHDLLYPPCSRWVFQHRYKIQPHDGCKENIERALSKHNYGDLPDPFNIFENSEVGNNGELRINDPVSKAGDYVEMRAEMNCLIAVSACAVNVGHTNAGRCKPIEITISNRKRTA